jgi:hypothetical protein
VKAQINAQGRLAIRAESDLEHYALRKWWDDRQQNKSSLEVEIISDTDPNTATYKTVRK